MASIKKKKLLYNDNARGRGRRTGRKQHFLIDYGEGVMHPIRLFTYTRLASVQSYRCK